MMRSDMAKVLTEGQRRKEKPRRPKGAERRIQRCPIDELPAKESMRKPWQVSRQEKWPGMSTAPLLRFLRSRVGRPWNQVFSEICSRLSLDEAVQSEIRECLQWVVAIDVMTVETAIHRDSGAQRSLIERRRPFYVHPESGLLMETDQ